MNKEEIIQALKAVRADSKKRKFSQTIDFQIKLQQLDLKKPENKVEVFATMPHARGKKVKVCALVGQTLLKDAQEHCDRAIIDDDFKTIGKDKKAMKKLVREFDYFVAQADKMPQVATSFGRFLGPLGKMPNPKAGGILPPKGSTKNINEKLQRTVKLSVKTELGVKCPVGKEDMDDDKIAENIMAVYNTLVNALAQHENNIKSSTIKFTMGKPVNIGGSKK
jgi:large subunit ribosomal protein L1